MRRGGRVWRISQRLDGLVCYGMFCDLATNAQRLIGPLVMKL